MKRKKEKRVRHRSTQIGIGTNDINAYLLFVYFCIFSNRGERRRRTDRTMKREMMFLNIVEKEKYKITHYQLSDERVQIRVHEGRVTNWDKVESMSEVEKKITWESVGTEF